MVACSVDCWAVYWAEWTVVSWVVLSVAMLASIVVAQKAVQSVGTMVEQRAGWMVAPMVVQSVAWMAEH